MNLEETQYTNKRKRQQHLPDDDNDDEGLIRSSRSSPLSLCSLPYELITNQMLPFLKPQECLQLSKSCKHLSNTAVLLPKIQLFHGKKKWRGQNHEGDKAYNSNIIIPVLLQHRIHSVTIICKWCDQGWGNRKGALYIVGTHCSSNNNEEEKEEARSGAPTLFGGGRVVWQSSPNVAPHKEEQLQATFVPHKDEIYHLWYKVGGGGGRQLFVSQCEVYTLISEDIPAVTTNTDTSSTAETARVILHQYHVLEQKTKMIFRMVQEVDRLAGQLRANSEEDVSEEDISEEDDSVGQECLSAQSPQYTGLLSFQIELLLTTIRSLVEYHMNNKNDNNVDSNNHVIFQFQLIDLLQSHGIDGKDRTTLGAIMEILENFLHVYKKLQYYYRQKVIQNDAQVEMMMNSKQLEFLIHSCRRRVRHEW